MSVTDKCDQLILAINSENNDKLSELVEKMDVGEINKISTLGFSALVTACVTFNDEAVNMLLAKRGIDVNVRNTQGDTPLYVAVHCNNDHAVSKIVASPGVDVNPQSVIGMTPLHMACAKHHPQIVAQLLACPGIEVNPQAVRGMTPLHYACAENHPLIVAQLLACPEIQVNIRGEDGLTPVMISAIQCDKESLQLLLDDPRVDIEVKHVDGRGLEVLLGGGCGDEGKMAECLEIINNARKKRKNIGVKQDASMAGGAGKANADDSQMDGAQKSENTEEGITANHGRSADLKVDYDSLCWSCSKTEVKLEKCEGCQKAMYCSRECREEDQLVHGPWCRKHCWGCEKTGVKLPKCGGCLKARYCNRECIVQDWNNHQEYCLKQQQERRIGKQ